MVVLDPASETGLAALYQQAQKAAEKAYAAYSRFRVGAAIRLSNGETVTGVNVENASYGLTICAERSAVVQAVSRFGPDLRIEAVAVANLNHAPSPPCGACRQVLSEFASAEVPVVYPGPDGPEVERFGVLMPAVFQLRVR